MKKISELLYEYKDYTDKNRGLYDYKIGHCYGETYDELFYKYKNKSIKLLEIGVQRGASLYVWNEYFDNVKIFGVDIKIDEPGHEQIKNFMLEDFTFILGDIKSDNITEKLENVNFDIIIDDGSHMLPDVLFVVENYVNKLNNDGILVIEDVQYPEFWLSEINKLLVNRNDLKVSFRDLRRNRNYDDFLIIINKI